MPVEIFFSYAHQDEKLREELEKQLSLLKWQGHITGWHDRRIVAGQEWAGEIDKHLNTADIILLLISPDFMASNYCYGVEVKRAMERYDRGEALVIPIILRSVYWQGAPFGKLQALPIDAKPVTGSHWHNLDEAFFNVAEGIRKAIESQIIKPLQDKLKTTHHEPTGSTFGFTNGGKPKKVRQDIENKITSLVPSKDAKTSQDVSEIGLAIADGSFSNYFELAKAIFRCMSVTASALIESPFHDKGTVWEVTLSPVGLRVSSLKTILLLRQKQLDHGAYNFLEVIATKRQTDFITVIDISNVSKLSIPSIQQHMIWFRAEDLVEMALQSNEQLPGWLGRFIILRTGASHLLPYKTHGAAGESFIGWEQELTRLIDTNRRGGFIMGAHRSGKTSLLYQIRKRMQNLGFQVIGPLIIGYKNDFQFLFERTLHDLDLDCPTDMTPEAWAEAIKAYSSVNNPPVFILDEVDDMLQIDARTRNKLSKQMRLLQQNGQCKFYLAGHSRLRALTKLEGAPFQNFAEEVTLTGLTESDGMRLIQEPMKLIGFEVNDIQARRIHHGAAGVPVLIQSFCSRLLSGLFHQTNKFKIEDAAIEEVEKSPDYLNEVLHHFQYAQTWDSTAIMLITAIHEESTNWDIIEEFSNHGVVLRRQQLAKHLSFLVKFGILEQIEANRYKILPRYLFQAIIAHEPIENLKAELGKNQSRTFQIDRKRVKTELSHTLKTEYVALLEQQGTGVEAMIDTLVNGQFLGNDMKFVSVILPRGRYNRGKLKEDFLERLIEASHHIASETEVTNKVLQAVHEFANRGVDFRIKAVLNAINNGTSAKYLVIVLHKLTEVQIDSLEDLFLMLREHHDQRNSSEEGSEKLRFLIAGGAHIWQACMGGDTDMSPFNIAVRIFFDGLSCEEIQIMDKSQNLEAAVRLRYLTDGIPSLIVEAIESSIETDGLSPFFQHLYEQWSTLPAASQQVLKRLVEGSESFPFCILDYDCPQIPILISPWAEAFWGGFLRIRYGTLSWRSPIHRAFIMEQTEAQKRFSWPTFLKEDLLERVESLENAWRKTKSKGKWNEGLEEALYLSVQTNNIELMHLLDMAQRIEDRAAILEYAKFLTLTSEQDWMKELEKKIEVHPNIIDNILIGITISRAKNFLS